jgi:hypothetical protein
MRAALFIRKYRSSLIAVTSKMVKFDEVRGAKAQYPRAVRGGTVSGGEHFATL